MLSPDHPRSRGVYQSVWNLLTKGDGSSPLARGLLVVSASLVFIVGIIPARAGFTPGRRGARYPSRDHPRSRGVYALPVGAESPLNRIIPARAGFTPPPSASCPRPSDHPRSRGVYFSMFVASFFASGSSPLARGLRLHIWAEPATHRIIPARAGFTVSTR